jgi:hypothetical protein
MLAKSALLPEKLRGKAPDIAVTLMAGQELGLSPMAALRGVYVVNGRPALAADTMVGLAHASGLCEYFVCVESTDKIATYETKRKGAPTPQRLSFTIEQAKRAGLGGDVWTKYPDSMLRARCKSFLARDVYSDVLAGVIEEHEVEEIQRQPAPAHQGFTAILPDYPDGSCKDATVEAEFVETSTPELTEEFVLAITTLAELRSLKMRLAALPETPAKDKLRTAYTVRWAQLKDDAK